jgi:hypothetical protein
MKAFVNFAYVNFFKPKQKDKFKGYETYSVFCNDKYKKYTKLDEEKYKLLWGDVLTKFK